MQTYLQCQKADQWSLEMGCQKRQKGETIMGNRIGGNGHVHHFDCGNGLAGIYICYSL